MKPTYYTTPILDFMRVCGSNNKTYQNDCKLENAACLNPNLRIVKNCYGRCPCQNTNSKPKRKGANRNGYGLYPGLFDNGQEGDNILLPNEIAERGGVFL